MKTILRVAMLSATLSSAPAMAEVESWYTYWGVGFASHNYPDEVDDFFEEMNAYPGVERTEMSLEAFGFYWPLINKRTLIGAIISGSVDSLDDGRDHVNLDQHLLSFSAMHFFGEEPGQGFFLRGDLGRADAEFTTSFTGDYHLGSGPGLLAGAGYGFAISAETRIILNLTYSSSRIDDDTYSTLAFNLAGLW